MVENRHEAKFLVIDGNHRLTFAKTNNQKKIAVNILTATDIINIDYNFFVTEFDKLLYIMINEFYYFRYLQVKYGIYHVEMEKLSYLNLGYFPFSDKPFGGVGLNLLK